MNVYYEINKGLADHEFAGVTNFVQYNVVVRNNSKNILFNIRAMQCSDRAWEESKHGVRYLKYRLAGTPPKVDMEEFMWTKLKSVPF